MPSRAITGHKGLLVLAVFLIVSMVSASEINIHVIPPKPQENQTVTLNVAGITETILFSEWYHGKEIHADNQIIRYNRDNTTSQGKKYFTRAEINFNGSLVITGVTKDLEGDYTVNIQGTSKSYQKTVELKLTAPPKNEDHFHLNSGQIAGIVIGVISALVVAVGVVIYLLKNKDSGPL